MKRIILITMLSLITLTILADSDPINNIKITSKSEPISINDLRPSTPKEAIFEDTDSINIEKISPKTPKEVDFEK